MIRAKHLICKSRSGLLYHQRQCKTVIVFQNLVEDSLWETDFDDIRHAVVRTESTQTCRPYVRQIIWPSVSNDQWPQSISVLSTEGEAEAVRVSNKKIHSILFILDISCLLSIFGARSRCSIDPTTCSVRET